MAITNARILIRRGFESDFNPDGIQPGEWALSTDEKIVRICVAPGACIRMATYDAFEADMSQIEAILEQSKSIQEAVTLINTEVSENAEAVVENTELAKQYRDEAKAFRDGAEAVAGVGIATEEKAGLVKPDGTTITVDEDGTIHSIGSKGTTDVVYLTQAEYDALPDTKLTDDVEYRITDTGINDATASNVSYNNTLSGIGATTVQQAVDELSSEVNGLNDSVGGLSDSLGANFLLKTFWAPPHLGISSYFIPDIIQAMPEHSIFVNGDSSLFNVENNKFPQSVGMVAIIKYSISRTIVFYSYVSASQTVHFYIGSINTTTNIVNEWRELF